jgi:hypothetical protein
MRCRSWADIPLLLLWSLVSATILQSCARGIWGGNGYPTYPGLEIELSSTGGVGGLTTAHLLTGEGYVYRWRAMERPEDKGDLLGRAEPALLDSIAALVSAPDLLTEGVAATGDMVRTLRVRMGIEEQRWSWVAGLSGKGTPEPIAPVADLLWEIIRRTETAGSTR